MSRPFGFPDPVNEVSARLVAGGVVLIAATALLFGQTWLVLPLAYGFVARVLAGPRFSPLGQFVTRVVTRASRAGVSSLVPSPARRSASPRASAPSSPSWRHRLVRVRIGPRRQPPARRAGRRRRPRVGVRLLHRVPRVFGLLMRAGVIPADTCAECNNFVPGTSPRRRAQRRLDPLAPPETPGARHQAFRVGTRQTCVNSSSRGSFS